MMRLPNRRTLLPPVFAAVLLSLVVGATLSPVSGAVPAQASCQYGDCPIIPFQQNLTFLLTVLFVILIAAVLGVLVAISRKLSRPPPEPTYYTEPEPSPSPPPEPEPTEFEPPVG
jgi:hypothetical protein